MVKTMNKSGAEMEMRNDTNDMKSRWEKEGYHHNQHSWISCCIRCDVRFTEWKNNGIHRWTNLSIFRFGFWIIQAQTRTQRHWDTGTQGEAEIVKLNWIESPLVLILIYSIHSTFLLYYLVWLLFLLVHCSYLECWCHFLHNIDSESVIFVRGQLIFAIY